MQTKLIMKELYDIEPAYLFDNNLCNYNKQVLPITALEKIDYRDIMLIFTMKSDNSLYTKLLSYLEILEISIVEIKWNSTIAVQGVGKYTYGDLINSPYVEEIGAFCSFAVGADVVSNHPAEYISTHPFIYFDSKINPYLPYEYKQVRDFGYYFDGIEPKGVIRKGTKSKIGNDVWLGRNVIITNGANIGNGVIAGANTVITKDVPDYAVVVGCPARIIRYRYEKHQIEALNRIAWWDWSDDEIRDRYDDFFLPIEKFIEKYDRNSRNF